MMGSPFTKREPGFSPRHLFARMPGLWAEPGLTTCFTDTAGTTPAIADQTVAKITELSAGRSIIQSTAANRPTLSARYNLLTYSEDFSNAAWSKAGLNAFGAGSVANATTAPDGTQTADLITENTGYSQHFIYFSVSNRSSSTLIGSIWAKYAGRKYISLRVDNGNAPYAVIDVQTGAVVSGSGVTVTAGPNQWYFLTTTKSLNDGPGYITIDFMPSAALWPFIYSGDGTSGVYIWGADLRLANLPANIPAYQRIASATDYDTTGFPLYLRHDATDFLTATLPSINVRRNLLTYSEIFTNSDWLKFRSSVSTGYGQNSDGVYAGTKIVENTATDTHGIANYGTTASAIAGAVYTLSVYVKAAERDYISLRGDVTSGTFGDAVQIHIPSKTITKNASNHTVIITASDYGWMRIAVSMTAAASAGAKPGIYTGKSAALLNTGIDYYAGDGVSGIYIWGAQFELGSTATPYQKVTDWTSEAFASSGSVYFGTPVGMSALHNQSIGTSHNLPAPQSDIYGYVITPERLSPVDESRLERYFRMKAGLLTPDYLTWDGLDDIVTADDGVTKLLAQ